MEVTNSMAVFEAEAVQTDDSAAPHAPGRLSTNQIAGLIFIVALAQFAFFTWHTLNQPSLDMWGFRPAQTAASVPYMLYDGRWFANIVPIFGEPWVFVLEFPFYQWCV